MMKLLPLLPLLTPSTVASFLPAAPENYHTISSSADNSSRSLAKEATITKTFKFKDDFFLRFSTLSTGISPEYGDELLNALEVYGEEFRDAWVTALLGDMPDSCAVEVCVFLLYYVYLVYVIMY